MIDVASLRERNKLRVQNLTTPPRHRVRREAA
jgi:hypothetical protein